MNQSNNNKSLKQLAQSARQNPDCTERASELRTARLERSRQLGIVVSLPDADVLYAYTWTLSDRGYAKARVNGKSVQLHVLIHSRMTGKDIMTYSGQKDAVRHISNLNKLDCRRDNLYVEQGQLLNSRELNRAIHSNNTSGVSGVYWNVQANRWKLQLGLEGTPIYFGLYSDLEEAKFVRDALVGYRMTCTEQGMNRDDTLTGMKARVKGLRAAWSDLNASFAITLFDEMS